MARPGKFGDRTASNYGNTLTFLKLKIQTSLVFFEFDNDLLFRASDTDIGLELYSLKAEVRPRDANGDCFVDFADFLILSSNFGQSGKSLVDGDFDGSGTVDFADFLILSSNFGE